MARRFAKVSEEEIEEAFFYLFASRYISTTMYIIKNVETTNKI